MSRQIDLEKPLSDSDREYLLQRGNTYAIALNAAHLGETVPTVDPFATPQVPSPPPFSGEGEGEGEGNVKAVEDMTVDELKNELEAAGQSKAGNKGELQARLIEHRASLES